MKKNSQDQILKRSFVDNQDKPIENSFPSSKKICHSTSQSHLINEEVFNVNVPNSPPPFSSIGFVVFLRTYSRQRIVGDLPSYKAIFCPSGLIRLIYSEVNAKRLITYYGHKSPTEESQELWEDTIVRVMESCQRDMKCGFSQSEIQELFDLMYYLKGFVAGRFFWQLGTNMVTRYGLMSLQNCAAICVDSWKDPFIWAFEASLLGVGVGFNIQYQYVNKIQTRSHPVQIIRKDTRDADFIVPDSREGWISFLREILQAHFVTKKSFTYSTLLVRSRGARIRGFGGIASGPDSLCDGANTLNQILNKVATRKERLFLTEINAKKASLKELLLKKDNMDRENENNTNLIEELEKQIAEEEHLWTLHYQHMGKYEPGQLEPVDVLDIMNVLAMIVVAGNTRRAAQMALGDPWDIMFLRAKRWDLGIVPRWRANSNNSVVCSDIDELPQEFWQGYKGHGEPYGLININLIRKCGRLGDYTRPDPTAVAVNPCGEQPLRNGETCCLAELVLPSFKSQKELLNAASLVYKICKHSLMLPCNSSLTQTAVREAMRMGIGITGYLSSTEEQRKWLPDTYKSLRSLDDQYSTILNLPKSIRITTCKPSGTLSLLPIAITPGVHPAIYRQLSRRVQFPADSKLFKRGVALGFPSEYLRQFGQVDYSTGLLSFPLSYPKSTTCANEISSLQQLEYVKRMQSDWSDNSVSCTVYYTKKQLPDIINYLRKEYRNSFKSLSFLLHSDHQFDQPPYEELDEKSYRKMLNNIKVTNPLDWMKSEENEELNQMFKNNDSYGSIMMRAVKKINDPNHNISLNNDTLSKSNQSNMSSNTETCGNNQPNYDSFECRSGMCPIR